MEREGGEGKWDNEYIDKSTHNVHTHIHTHTYTHAHTHAHIPLVLCHVEGDLVSLMNLPLIIHIREGVRHKEKLL